MDRPTDGRTYTPSYRDETAHLKKKKKKKKKKKNNNNNNNNSKLYALITSRLWNSIPTATFLGFYLSKFQA